MTLCYCGSNKEYSTCCEPLHTGKEKAKTALDLMRSRYSAYVVGDIDYVANTQTNSEDFDFDDAKKWSEESTWLGLEIIDTKKGQDQDKEGIVEFKVSYNDNKGEEFIHHERSSFIKDQDQWLFEEGELVTQNQGTFVRSTPKVGRNETCPCGSGKKFKKCCGKA